MLLLKHLKENYTNDLSLDNIEHNFMHLFGVKVKREDDLFLFKYDQLAVKWLEPISHECRGIIVRFTDGNWKVASRPFDKFFNRHEGHCSVFEKDAFNSRCSEMAFVEKPDGTCITVYFDTVKNRWRASTLGTITPAQCGDSPWTFEELFWTTLTVHYPKSLAYITKELDHELTLICELCTTENRILTKYPEDRIYFLGLRCNNQGHIVNTGLIAKELGLRLPIMHKFIDLGISNLAEAEAYVEGEAKKEELYGEYAEGMVVYNIANSQPICKMKNSLYIQLHHTIGAGDIRCTRNRVIEAFFCGNMDDVYPVLVPSMQTFADKLRDWWADKIVELMDAAEDCRGKVFDTEKDYAMFVHKNVDKKFMAFFFTNKVDVLNADEIPYGFKLADCDSDSFSTWMKNHYKKYEVEMKALSGI